MKSAGEDISEIRIHYSPEYRVYFAQRDRLVILLLVGGGKSSQSRDIIRAKALAETVEE